MLTILACKGAHCSLAETQRVFGGIGDVLVGGASTQPEECAAKLMPIEILVRIMSHESLAGSSVLAPFLKAKCLQGFRLI